MSMTDRRLPELIGICVLDVAWHWRLIANSLPWSLPRLRVLQVTQCARSFGEGAGGEPEAPTRIREQCCGPTVCVARG